MKLQRDDSAAYHTVTGHGPGFVAVDGRKMDRSLLLLPDRFDPAWGPPCYAELALAHMEALVDLGCPVLLLGTGERQRFPAAALLRPLVEAGVGIEIMSTAAACRTYTLLAAEGRRIAAALIVE